MTYPSGIGLSTSYSYFGNTGDQRLEDITNAKSGTTMSKFDYTYNPAGTIATWLSRDPSGEQSDLNVYEYCSDNTVAFSDPEGLEQVAFTIISVIRPPAHEAGVKSQVSVTVDTDTGQMTDHSLFIGSTFVGRTAFPGGGSTTNTASGGCGKVTVHMTGRFNSHFLPLLHIFYDFTIHYDSDSGTTTVSGSHTQFPSFEIYKNGTEIYDFQQDHLNDLQFGFP
jgi:RHS repeat-associated protein